MRWLVAFVLFGGSALAQSVGPTPSQVAVDIVGNVSLMARMMENQTREIQNLQAQVKQLQDELAKLKDAKK